MLDWPADTESIVEDSSQSSGPGNCLAIEMEFEQVTERITTFGSLQRSAKAVAGQAAKNMRDYQDSGAVIGLHLADQLLLPLALAKGGSFLTMTPSNHIKTNAQVIESFLSAAIELKADGSLTEISVPRNE